MKAKSIQILAVNTVTSLALVFTSLLTPFTVYADDPAPCTPPTFTTPGVHAPTGADSGTYHYDCDLKLYVNEHYYYNPETNVTYPKVPPTYTCNAATLLYDYNAWMWSDPRSTYVLRTFSVSTPPAGANIVACPTPYTASISNTGANSTNTTGLGGSINNTGESSTNTIDESGGTDTTINNDTAATISNTIIGAATSGSSSVLSNTNGGSATSGNSTDIANVVNLLQSQANMFGQGDFETFTANINGDVNGDLLLDPALLSTIQPTAGSPNLDNNFDINNSVSASINNNITLDSVSGDATVDANTNAGDATTGNATAIANLINMINSAVTAGKSFVGTVNINGNLNGDILLPANFIDQLIAANVPTATISLTGAGSTNTIDQHPQGENLTLTNTNNQGITNNISTTAVSGTANSGQNTNAGSATTGNATTNITAFNLTGSEVIGSNALLVFVNVMGTWVGMIVNAPAGSTAAALGGGLTTNRAGYNTTNVNNTNDASITNNVDVEARSGDANLTRNTNAGNARTGDARAAVNALNIQNSALSLGGWFGVLFINVFGSWNGSFGINTAAGNPVSTGGIIPGSFGGGANVANAAELVRFAPRFAATANSSGSNNSGVSSTVGTVLASQTQRVSAAPTSESPTPTLQTNTRSYFLPVLAVLLFIAAVLLEQMASRKPSRSS